MPPDPKRAARQRKLNAQAAARRRASAPGYDGRAATATARAAFWARLYAQVDPTGSLPPAERDRRAKSLFLARMAAGKAKKLGDHRRAA